MASSPSEEADVSTTPKQKAVLDEVLAAFEGDGIILVVLRDPKGEWLDAMSIHGRARDGARESKLLLEPLAQRFTDLIVEAWEAVGVKVEVKNRR